MEPKYLTMKQLTRRYPSDRGSKGHVSRNTIYQWIKEIGFPRPLRIGGQASWWKLEDVEAWEELRESKTE